MILGLRTAIYPIPDLAKGKAWYSQVLGCGPYFDEPFYVGFSVGGRVTEDRYHLAENEKKLRNSKTRPYSVAFRLRKTPPGGITKGAQARRTLNPVAADVL